MISAEYYVDRLRRLCKRLGTREVASRLGVSSTAVSLVTGGQRVASSAMRAKLVAEFGAESPEVTALEAAEDVRAALADLLPALTRLDEALKAVVLPHPPVERERPARRRPTRHPMPGWAESYLERNGGPQ